MNQPAWHYQHRGIGYLVAPDLSATSGKWRAFVLLRDADVDIPLGSEHGEWDTLDEALEAGWFGGVHEIDRAFAFSRPLPS